jgi:hypothetical protein
MKSLISLVWNAFYKYSFGAINFVVTDNHDQTQVMIQFQSLDVNELVKVTDFIKKHYPTDTPMLVKTPVVKSKHIGFTCNYYFVLDPNTITSHFLPE